MIQRIQTLWLLLVVLLCGAMFYFPLARYTFDVMGADNSVQIYKLIPIKNALYQQEPALISLIANILTIVLSCVTIFLYKNRVLQLKVLAFVFLIVVAHVALLFFYQIDLGLEQVVGSLYKGHENEIATVIQKAKTTYLMGSYFPIAQVVCLVMARNGIRNDIIKVRQSDHLR